MNAPDRDATTILDALATQDRALRIAIRAHERQHRKSDHDLPYITHPIAVATIVATHGFSATTVAAAYLHDVLEDTAWSAEDLLTASVERWVLDIVRECSEAAKLLSWRERKRDLISRMRTCSREAAAVMCADKLHNASSTLPHILERGRSSAGATSGAIRSRSCGGTPRVSRPCGPTHCPTTACSKPSSNSSSRPPREPLDPAGPRARRGPIAEKTVSRRKTAGAGGPLGLP